MQLLYEITYHLHFVLSLQKYFNFVSLFTFYFIVNSRHFQVTASIPRLQRMHNFHMLLLSLLQTGERLQSNFDIGTRDFKMKLQTNKFRTKIWSCKNAYCIMKYNINRIMKYVRTIYLNSKCIRNVFYALVFRYSIKSNST